MKTKSNIFRKVAGIVGILMISATIIFLAIYMNCKREYEARQNELNTGSVIVSLNEIRSISGEENVIAKTDALIEDIRENQLKNQTLEMKHITIFYAITMIGIVVVFTMIYVLVIRPFIKLEAFAAEVAQGNLETDLKYERVHLFGEFTWAFDHMRREIRKARQCEKEAIENNKTVIATLSHDIKTPIASIRAYSEALEANMDSTPERRKRYIEVITRKCDEVTKITNDMFIHSLHDLKKLVIKKERVNIRQIIEETVFSMEGNSQDITIKKLEETVLQRGDAGRIAQVIENIINNARKYAPGKIELDTEIEGDKYLLTIRDYGEGISPEDMPFVFDKFYRGKNKGEQPGAGLGLFIVKYIMEQMDGTVELIKLTDGMLVKLIFSIS